MLITGETGTGKEMVARAIHRASDRADRPFLPFNCAAVPRDLLESQLFGHRKGAFTGADAGFPGVIRSAAGGTLFLDEIGEIGPEMQPKLLRFLETHEIHPLGEPHPIKVDVRVIAATNASVEQLMADGRFRGDLFYRLNVDAAVAAAAARTAGGNPAAGPALRPQVRDEQRKGQLTVADDTLEYLLLFSWPGNVRQLANEVQRMVALAEPDSTLTPALLSPEIQASRRTMPATPAAELEVRVALDQPLPVAVDMLEQVMVRRALDRTHGRVEEASRLLGISRKGLFLKRRRWGLGAGLVSRRYRMPPKNDGSGMSRMVCSPGATSRIFGSELTTIDAVAMSPCTPPATLDLIAGEPTISTESYDSGAPRYASMCSVMTGWSPR